MIHLHVMNTLKAARDQLGGDELTDSDRVSLVRAVELVDELVTLERSRSREVARVADLVKEAERAAAAELLEVVRSGKDPIFSALVALPGANLSILRAELVELEAGAGLVHRAGLVAEEELRNVIRSVHERRNPRVKKAGNKAENPPIRARKVAGRVGQFPLPSAG